MTNTRSAALVTAIAYRLSPLALLRFSRPIGSRINAEIRLSVNLTDRDLADEFVANIAAGLEGDSAVEIKGEYHNPDCRYYSHLVRVFVALTGVSPAEVEAVEAAARQAGWLLGE